MGWGDSATVWEVSPATGEVSGFKAEVPEMKGEFPAMKNVFGWTVFVLPPPAELQANDSSGMSPEHQQTTDGIMANYDEPGLMYDSGVHYDAGVPPTTTGKKMAKVKLGLDKLSPDGLVGLADQIKTAMTGNANFTTPNPTLTSIGTLITTAQTKIAAQKAAVQTSMQATSDRDAALVALSTALVSLASYVDNASGGDAVKIHSAGMSVKAAAAPIGALEQTANLSVSAGDDDGELEATWDPVRGAKSYEVQTSPDPITSTSWRSVSPSAKSKKTITGLTSGQRTWVRVRAIAPKEENNGAWSDPAVKIVP